MHVGNALVALLLSTVALTGCLGGDGDGAEVDETATPDVPDVRPELVEPTFLPEVLLGASTIGAEPSIVADATGTVYVTTAGALFGGFLWSSHDGGSSYEAVGEPGCFQPLQQGPCPPGFEMTDAGMDGGGDADLAADANGTLYWAGLAGASGPIPFQRSEDGGQSWTEPVDLSEGVGSDREWIDARPNGTVYVTWREFGDTQAIIVRTSFDRGDTWSEKYVVDEPAYLSGPIVHDPSAEATVYIPYFDGAIRIARSDDHGRTWESFEAFDDSMDRSLRASNPLYIFPVASVDQDGNVYLVWANDPAESSVSGVKEVAVPVVWFTRSTDRGATWAEPLQLSTPGKAAIFPWVAAGARGRVAIAWYENTVGLPNEVLPDLWNVRLVESVTADGPEPAFVGGQLNGLPFHIGAICTDGGGCLLKAKDRSMLDFFEVAIRPDGQPVVTWAADPVTVRGRVDVYAGGVETGTPLV